MRSRTHLPSLSSLLLAGLLCLLAVPAEAQLSKSLGVGIAVPQGDLNEAFDTGYTLRGQLQLSALGLFSLHGQAGWTRFGAQAADVEDADLFHAGVGARLTFLPLIFVGLNAAYGFGDSDEEAWLFPEVGVGLGPVEVIADYRFGDEGWFGLRAALKF